MSAIIIPRLIAASFLPISTISRNDNEEVKKKRANMAIKFKIRVIVKVLFL